MPGLLLLYVERRGYEVLGVNLYINIYMDFCKFGAVKITKSRR